MLLFSIGKLRETYTRIILSLVFENRPPQGAIVHKTDVNWSACRDNCQESRQIALIVFGNYNNIYKKTQTLFLYKEKREKPIYIILSKMTCFTEQAKDLLWFIITIIYYCLTDRCFVKLAMDNKFINIDRKPLFIY